LYLFLKLIINLVNIIDINTQYQFNKIFIVVITMFSELQCENVLGCEGYVKALKAVCLSIYRKNGSYSFEKKVYICTFFSR